MLDERTLSRMDATALRTYIKTLHETLGHILRAAGEAQDYVRRDGTFHHMSEKHLDQYIAEFAGRHNRRNGDTIDVMAQTVRSMAGKRLRYRELVAD